METATDRLLKCATVQGVTDLSTSSLYALMQDRDPETRFPQPIKIGHRSRWSERAVQDWIARQKARAAVAT
jgi:predicted DNA-binding transcriptional regulator AlpA